MKTNGDDMNGLEQDRRDLKRMRPDLYSYVTAAEQARAYDQAGNLASGAISGEAAANRLWQRASVLRKQVENLQQLPRET